MDDLTLGTTSPIRLDILQSLENCFDLMAWMQVLLRQQIPDDLIADCCDMIKADRNELMRCIDRIILALES